MQEHQFLKNVSFPPHSPTLSSSSSGAISLVVRGEGGEEQARASEANCLANLQNSSWAEPELGQEDTLKY